MLQGGYGGIGGKGGGFGAVIGDRSNWGGAGGASEALEGGTGRSTGFYINPYLFFAPPPLLKVPTPPPKSWAPKPIVEYNHPLEPDGKKGMEVLLGGKEGGGRKGGWEGA